MFRICQIFRQLKGGSLQKGECWERRGICVTIGIVAGTNWMQEILGLIWHDGDPSWVQSVHVGIRSPWIETVFGLKTALEIPPPRLLASHLPFQLFPKSFLHSKAKVREDKCTTDPCNKTEANSHLWGTTCHLITEEIRTIYDPLALLLLQDFSSGHSGWRAFVKVIYTMRNPKDVLISYYHHSYLFKLFKDPGSLEEFLEEFLNGNVPYGSWFDHVKNWLEMKDKPNFFYITYEELQQDLRGSVERICSFLGKELNSQQIDSVVENASFHKMKDNKMSNFTQVPEELIDHKKGTFMRKGTMDTPGHLVLARVQLVEFSWDSLTRRHNGGMRSHGHASCCTHQSLQPLDVPGITGDWKNHLTVAQSERFDCAYQEKMRGVHMSFPWE
ncbi:Sulfotransferase family cytosolic 2B member 1 [Varanus komodoensis]|nr:Sulfotransferase family cytosolic 2B member 1 [Varanus komodoensis]